MPDNPALQHLKKYIRVRSEKDARFVEFDFAIGSPDLFVELVMPPAAFAAFCQTHNVVQMSADEMAAIDSDSEKWRFGYDTLVSHAR